MKSLRKKKALTREENAAFAIIKEITIYGALEFQELEALDGVLLRFTNPATGVAGLIKTPDYIAGRDFALDQKWITGSGTRFAIATKGQEMLEAQLNGTYKSQSAQNEVDLVDHLKHQAFSHPLLGYLIFAALSVSAFIAIINGGLDTFLKTRELFKDAKQQVAAPEVSLRLTNLQAPAVVFANHSSQIAKNIKVAFAIWNLQSITPANPLPIPITTFDWIQPDAEGGPMHIDFERFHLRTGDHLIGSMSVNCPNCVRPKTYLISILWGKSGWFCEESSEHHGYLLVPKTLTTDGLSQFALEIERQAPQRLRIPL